MLQYGPESKMYLDGFVLMKRTFRQHIAKAPLGIS